jgi:hypothetical protein
MDYGTLVAAKESAGSIRSWINYSLIDAEGVLQDAQSYIYGALRTREMKQTTPVTISSGASSAALPDRFLEAISLIYTDGTGELAHVTEQALERAKIYESANTLVSEQPFKYSVYGELLQFPCKADAAYTASLLFFQRPHYLASTAGKTSNFLTTRYPALLRSACLMFAADYRDDDARYKRWNKRTDELIARANVEADLSLRGAILTE